MCLWLPGLLSSSSIAVEDQASSSRGDWRGEESKKVGKEIQLYFTESECCQGTHSIIGKNVKMQKSSPN